MLFVFGVRSILVIFCCIISKFGYQTVAFEIPGLQELLEIAQVIPRNTVTHPPEEAPLTQALCNLKTVCNKDSPNFEKKLILFLRSLKNY